MRYKVFGSGTGLRVSEVALGCGMFGTRWGYGSDPETVHAMIGAYLDAGGNFIDTADNYQFGESEEIVGRCIADRRDEVVLGTKFACGSRDGANSCETGNSRRAMMQSVDASLKRLNTDYIDIYWVHAPDELTRTDDMMRALDDLVRAGKIHYIGFSDFPAWRVARAATIAELRHLAPLAGIQIEYSLIERTGDRELRPMADAMGITVAAWSPLAGGLLTGKYRRGESGRSTHVPSMVHSDDNGRHGRILDTVEAIAAELGITPTRVSIAWLLATGVLPILGCRNLEQLHDNLGACDVTLSEEQIARLSDVSRISLGFPYEMLGAEEGRMSIEAGIGDRTERPLVPVA